MSTSDSPPEQTAFKYWFDAKAASQLAKQFSKVYPDFDRKKFLRLAKKDLNSLEFQARIRQFAAALAGTLPHNIPEALRILIDSLPPAQTDCETLSDGWLQWPLGYYISDYAIDHFEESMEAMTELTTRFSSEFAVRPFIETYPKQTLAALKKLSSSPNPHVRRWTSEGSRPRLPWGKKLHHLIADPSPALPILEALKDDNELYVRRSVANHLNDIAKDHPDLVVSICKRWMKNANPNRSWLVKHSLRTLIKDGHPGALAVLGFGPPTRIEATLRLDQAKISIGESVQLTAQLKSSQSRTQKLVVDYAVHYVRKGGKSSVKVFKWKTFEIPAGESIDIGKRHSMKVTTIRALYPGLHHIELQVNGVRMASSHFELLQ